MVLRAASLAWLGPLWGSRSNRLKLRSSADNAAWCVVSESGDASSLFVEAWRSRRPLLARQAADVSWWSQEMEDEIAGLSLEQDVTSRLVWGGGAKVEAGPLSDEQLRSLPSTEWTVLVNDVEALSPSVGAFARAMWAGPLRCGAWARDDAMVSLAAPGGGVGPHVDSNDVVLVQVAGRRKWALARTPVYDFRRDEAKEATCISDFEPDVVLELEPGDWLFVPARVPHEGVATRGVCATVSLGFRSYSALDLATRWIDTQAFWDERDSTHVFSGLVHDRPNALPPAAVAAAKAAVLTAFERKLDDTLVPLLGECLTASRDEKLDRDADAWNAVLVDHLEGTLVVPDIHDDDLLFLPAAGTRLAFYDDDTQVRLFVDGKASAPLPLHLAPFVRLLAESDTPFTAALLRDFAQADSLAADLLTELTDQGHLIAMRRA